MSERATFSPFWHRVRALKPRLRPHVQITRQHYRGSRWHVVHDPASNAYYRLSPVSHEFLSLLDGKRTVEQVWELSLTRHGDDAPTQNEVIQLLSQLFTSNLLAADVPPETEQLLRRGRERLGKKVQQQLIGLMYFRIKLFNPDFILRVLEPIFRPLLNRVGLVAWAAWVIFALAQVLPEWSRIQEEFRTVTDPGNWGWLMAVYVVLKLIHETGHGLICKRFGGQVPEFGIMMLVLVPSPYVDASAAWAFSSKWQRIAVGAGGMIFELAVAAGAALVWKNAGGSPFVSQLAFNAMLTASISTLLFNANPLMKFDGYYMLSDLLEVPNLMQRSTNMLKFLMHKHVYRMRNPVPPTSQTGEALILFVYGLGAMVYRIVLFFSITLYVMGQMFALGLVLAVWTAAMWFILPAGQFVHWLASSPQLAEKRGRAILVSLLMIGVGLLLVGAVPFPDWRRAEGVVWSEERTGVYFGADGFVQAAHKRPGDRVTMGEPIVTCSSPQLVADYRVALAQLDESRVLERQAIAKNAAAALVAKDRVEAFEKLAAYYKERLDRLVVRAPHDGVVVLDDPAKLVGAYVHEGQLLCEVVNTASNKLRITAGLSQSEALWLYELGTDAYRVEVRRMTRVHEVIPAKTERVLQAGIHEVEHQSLTYSGGGTMEPDAKDPSGLRSKRPQFTAYFKADFDPAERGEATTARAGLPLPGERVRLRFTLPSKPLLAQWTDRLNKLLQGRAKV